MTPNPCAQAAQISVNFVNLGAWKIFILGIVQGITELLPISSTAHLRIVPALLGWPDPGSAFSAAMQLASLVAVLTFLWPDVTRLTREATAALGRNNWRDHSLRMASGIVIGTIPIGVAGLLLQKRLNQCDSPLRGIAVIGWACVVIWAAYSSDNEDPETKGTNQFQTEVQPVTLANDGTMEPVVFREGVTLFSLAMPGMVRL